MSRVAQLQARWSRLCADIAEEARNQGASEPFIFACESGLCVLDGPAHPDNGAGRGDEVLFTLRVPIDVAYDAGGW